MKTIRVVDTNVILRYLLADHPEHFARASEFMAGLKSGNQTAYIPESVLAECVFVLLVVLQRCWYRQILVS
jgi:predicted nucleic acid-binding protein